jgi:hypothetical protein
MQPYAIGHHEPYYQPAPQPLEYDRYNHYNFYNGYSQDAYGYDPASAAHYSGVPYSGYNGSSYSQYSSVPAGYGTLPAHSTYPYGHAHYQVNQQPSMQSAAAPYHIPYAGVYGAPAGGAVSPYGTDVSHQQNRTR